jgi:hypothetical protein
MTKALIHLKGISSRIVAPFQQLIKVVEFRFRASAFYVINLSNNKTLFPSQKCKIQINEIAISKITLNKKYLSILKAMPLVAIAYYTTNSKYKIEAQQQIVTTNVGLEVKKFSMLSLNRNNLSTIYL